MILPFHHFDRSAVRVIDNFIAVRRVRHFSEISRDHFLQVGGITTFSRVKLRNRLVDIRQVNLLLLIFLRLADRANIIRHCRHRIASVIFCRRVGGLRGLAGIIVAATGQNQSSRNRKQKRCFHAGNLTQAAKNPRIKLP